MCLALTALDLMLPDPTSSLAAWLWPPRATKSATAETARGARLKLLDMGCSSCEVRGLRLVEAPWLEGQPGWARRITRPNRFQRHEVDLRILRLHLRPGGRRPRRRHPARHRVRRH